MFDVADVQTSTVRSKPGRAARAVVLRVQDWIAEPHQDLAVVAGQLGGNTDSAAAAGTLADLAGNLEANAATTRERY